MAENANSEISAALEAVSKATMSPQVVKTSGAGKAYQSVAQSTAIAVQDAADHLRNMETIVSTAMGVALAQMLADPKNASSYTELINNINTVMTDAATNFQTIGQDAGTVLTNFPSS